MAQPSRSREHGARKAPPPFGLLLPTLPEVKAEIAGWIREINEGRIRETLYGKEPHGSRCRPLGDSLRGHHRHSGQRPVGGDLPRQARDSDMAGPSAAQHSTDPSLSPSPTPDHQVRLPRPSGPTDGIRDSGCGDVESVEGTVEALPVSRIRGALGRVLEGRKPVRGPPPTEGGEGTGRGQAAEASDRGPGAVGSSLDQGADRMRVDSGNHGIGSYGGQGHSVPLNDNEASGTVLADRDAVIAARGSITAAAEVSAETIMRVMARAYSCQVDEPKGGARKQVGPDEEEERADGATTWVRLAYNDFI